MHAFDAQTWLVLQDSSAFITRARNTSCCFMVHATLPELLRLFSVPACGCGHTLPRIGGPTVCLASNGHPASPIQLRKSSDTCVKSEPLDWQSVHVHPCCRLHGHEANSLLEQCHQHIDLGNDLTSNNLDDDPATHGQDQKHHTCLREHFRTQEDP